MNCFLLFIFVFLASSSASIFHDNKNPKHHEVKKVVNVTNSKSPIDSDIKEALTNIENANKTATATIKESSPRNEENGQSIANEARALLDNKKETTTSLENGTIETTAGQIIKNAKTNETAVSIDMFTKTRNELKNDIEDLEKYYFVLHQGFNKWMMTNRHQNFESMIIGGSSAIIVLIIYQLLKTCCNRRTRAHLSSFT